MTIVPPPTLYNQSVLKDKDFVANFVARQETLRTLCRRFDCIDPEDDGQHQILIGARGMGKTFLLRRLSIEIHGDETLSERFVPLLIREEQYNVLSLRDFWRNCGESLAEWAEICGLVDLAERLDVEVPSKAWADDKKSAEIFETELQSLGKRAVLLIDNLDLILDSLKKSDLWSLRSRLQARGGPILIGAATQPIREAADRDAAFYEFFQPYYLKPLSLPETKTCMRSLAKQRGKAGQRVIEVLQTEPAKLPVLHRLTGGNPRILAFTYRLLETEGLHSAMANLERLLDEVTPYYKALVEEYNAGQQRAIIDAIALHWDPATTRELSRITGLPTTTISPQIMRLRKDGLIETTETSGSYSGHQIVERFFNIWYLMRHGTRHTKLRMRWLVAFLSNFYTRKQLIEIDHEARESRKIEDWTKEYAVAVEQAIQVAPLEHRANVLGDAAGDAGRIKTELPLTSDAAEAHAMVNKGVALGQGDYIAGAIKTFDAVIERFGDSDDAQMQDATASAMVNKGVALSQGGDRAAAVETCDALIERFGNSDDAQMQNATASAMVNKGVALSQGGDMAAAIETFDTVVERFGDSVDTQMQAHIAMVMANKGVALSQGGDRVAAVETFDTVVERFGNSDGAQMQEATALAMVNKGLALSQDGDTAAAIETFDTVVERFGNSDDAQMQEATALAMVNKGLALSQDGDTAAAIETFDAVVERFGNSDDAQMQEATALAMVNKGLALSQDGDTAAAIETFDAVIEHFGDSDDAQMQVRIAMVMVNKGGALRHGGDRVAAIKTFDAVVERFGDSDDAKVQEVTAKAMVNKGLALSQDGDTAAAIETFDTVVERFGDSDDVQMQEVTARAMINKGLALSQDGDTAAVIGTFDAVVERFGDSDDAQMQEATALAMINKGLALSQDGDTAAAIETFDAVVERFGDSDDVQMQEVTARAMINKGLALSQDGDTAAAIGTFDAVVKRFGDSDDAQMQEATALAMVNKGLALGQDGDTAAAIETFDAVVERFGDSDDAQMRKQVADALIGKGGLLPKSAAQLTCFEKALDLSLCRKLQQSFPKDLAETRILVANALMALRTEPDRAEELYLAAKEHKKDSGCTNLFWLYLSENRLSDAEETMTQVDGIPSQVRAIMNTGLALQAENYGDATKNLKTALVTIPSTADVELRLIDSLERLIRLAIANSCGERLIDWFERTNFGDRYAPIYAALKAVVRGKKLLLDVNPETREAAEIIMNRLSPDRIIPGNAG